MSDRMTSIHLPGLRGGPGIAEYGRQSVDEMHQRIRHHAERQKAEADVILAAPKEAFLVETFIGVYARSRLEIIQAPSKTSKR